MPELRWILILLGLLLIVVVYLVGRRRPRPVAPRREPRFNDETVEDVGQPEDDVLARPIDADDDWSPRAAATEEGWRADEPGEYPSPGGVFERSVAEPVTDGDQKIVAVRVAARSSTRFRGQDVVRLLQDEGLEFGKYAIFHRNDDRSQATLFSVASMVEPGSFDLDAIETEHLPGVTLFVVLPGPPDGIAALDNMLETAHRLADQLNGEILDQTGSTLSRQRASNLRDEIVAFQHHLAIQQRHAPVAKSRRRFL